MKRVFIVFLIMLMICSAAACGRNNDGKGEAANATQPSVTEAAADETAAAEKPTAAPEATEAATDEPAGQATDAPADGAATYGNITLKVPNGWYVQPGGVGGTENEDSLTVFSSDSPYLYVWVLISTRANIEANIAMDTSEPIDPFTVGGATWQGKDLAFYGEIAGKLYFISLSPYLHHDDEPVQDILASLAENAE